MRKLLMVLAVFLFLLVGATDFSSAADYGKVQGDYRIFRFGDNQAVVMAKIKYLSTTKEMKNLVNDQEGLRADTIFYDRPFTMAFGFENGQLSQIALSPYPDGNPGLEAWNEMLALAGDMQSGLGKATTLKMDLPDFNDMAYNFRWDLERISYILGIANEDGIYYTICIIRPQPSIQSPYTPYVNARYGFRVEYPNQLIPQAPPDNGDGRTFISADGLATLWVWGSMNFNGLSTQAAYQEALRELRGVSPALKVVKGDWFVLSWAQNGRIYYQKSFVTKDVIYAMRFEYPVSQRGLYDKVTEHIEKSFKIN